MNDLRKAIARYGKAAKEKLTNPSAKGEPEDQLRAPFEHLLVDLAALAGIKQVAAVGETTLRHLQTRPDYAVTVSKALVGYVELKAPGKGADPRKFKDKHDREQWEKLQSLPNVLYADGNAFSLWRSGALEGAVVRMIGDVETSGADLDAPTALTALFENFLSWEPQPPKSAKELAETSARLCRLLRDEVTEQLAEKNDALSALKTDWRKLLFPDADDLTFADGYAQAVTFGLLMARAQEIDLDESLHEVAKELGKTSALIGAAMRILTDDLAGESGLKTSIDTLRRVLGVVQWPKISKGKQDAWLYFYEDFLNVYDQERRKQTGSYYTPPEVVQAMTRLVDDVLRARFDRPEGLAASDVTIADPAVGTGTFLLGVLAHIERTVTATQGEGAVPGKIVEAVERLIAFELQLGPFAVAQLRIMAEVSRLLSGGDATTQTAKALALVPKLKMFVTDTLGNPHDDSKEYVPGQLAYRAISESRQAANRIKRDVPIHVVIGNPPYKEKAKGRGGWIESGEENAKDKAPLADWIPPADWKVSAHAKHLRNLYVYFWRWATRKVFDQDPGHGVVCFITVAGFLNGPGFQRMRDYLRRKSTEIWVIDCSPEGHQPEVSTRIFQGVQQPVCIVLAARSAKKDADVPAIVRFRALPEGHRQGKFEALAKIDLNDSEWKEAPSDWRAPFFPAAAGAWSDFVPLQKLFVYDASGSMPGRTWVIAPDKQSLLDRWDRLIAEADLEKKEALFHPHLRKGKPGDKHIRKKVSAGLAGHPYRSAMIAEETEPALPPVRYAFRSFDRQWLLPDARVINQPNPELWRIFSKRQVFLTALDRTSPSNGPALTLTGLVPDQDHYKGSFSGRVLPLWRDAAGTESNVVPALLVSLSNAYGAAVSAEDVFAYVAAVLAHPAFTSRFQEDLKQPGLRVPITADVKLFREAVELGKRVVWLHAYGERFADPKAGRPQGPPRMAKDVMPQIQKGGAIPPTLGQLPDTINYDPATQRLLIGTGFVDHVPPAVWKYEVSGKQVLRQWFSYRKQDREKPLIGDRRKPSALGNIQPDHWLAEYTTDLMDLLNVLGLVVAIEPKQQDLLERICAGPLLTFEALEKAGAFAVVEASKKPKAAANQVTMF